MKLQMIENNFKCSNCGELYKKWIGKCLKCNEWNSLETFLPEIQINKNRKLPKIDSFKLSDIVETMSAKKIPTCFNEFNTVLGGGLISDQFLLVGGEPGIGKSTLILQVFMDLADKGYKVLYVSGEESISQIKDRIKRVDNKYSSGNISLITETKLEVIQDIIEREKPKFIVIDSIQTTTSLDLNSMSGSINQIRYVAETFMNICKKNNICICIIGHVTKDGELAGPKTLEHIVDTVLNIDGDRYHTLRILRSSKNRFGPVSEIGIFEINDKGIKEMSDAFAFIDTNKPEGSYGFSISCGIEGSKAILMEIQALSNITYFGYPKRTSSGIKLNKLNLIIAVIEKYLNIKLDNQDIYLNLAGGLTSNDTALDLSIACSIISSYNKKPLKNNFAFIGEIGLSGEIRKVPYLEKRINSMIKAGIKTVVCPNQEITMNKKIEIIKSNSLKEIINHI